MAEHLTEQQIEGYRRRESDPGARQAIAAHFASCDECAKRVINADSAIGFEVLTESLLAPVDDEPFHLSQDELRGYVNGTVDRADRIICESHIDICESCTEELRLLSAIPSAQGRGNAPSITERWSWLRQGWGTLTPVRAAIAVGVIGLLVLAVLQLRRQSTVPTSEELAGDPASKNQPASLPPVASTGPSNEVTPGSSSQPNTSSSTLILLKDNGQEVRLNQEGKLTGLEGFDDLTQRMASVALTGESLAKPKALNELVSSPIELLGESQSEGFFKLVSPLGKIITEQRPTVRWQRLEGASGYVVSIFDANFNRIATSPILSGPSWTPPTPLPRGRTYSWEVTASKDGKEITAPVAPAPRAQFRILEPEKLKALTTLKQHKPASHLALGLLAARFGLVNEAEREFRQLVNENPDSVAAKKLLRTVQSWQAR
ncbi:MAG: hypothetical protein ABI596_03840 [Pyrinomonadaceae bacterium]